MFESDDPSNLGGHQPKAFLDMAKYNQAPQGTMRGYLQANPNTIIRYDISNYNRGHGEIRQSTLPEESFTQQTLIRPAWFGIPPGHMDYIKAEKSRLKDKNAAATPEIKAQLQAQAQWSGSVVVLLMSVLVLTMYAIYAV
jgi:hypothetical protein